MKLTDNNLPAMSVNFLRLLFAFLITLIVCPIIDKNTFKVTKKDLGLYAVIGLIFGIAATLHATAYFFAPISNVILITSSYFIIIILLDSLFLKEHPKKITIVAGLMGLLGISVINPFQAGSYLIGNVLALFTALFAGILYTMMRYADKNHSIGDIMWIFLFATLFLSPFAFVSGFTGISSSLIWIFLSGSLSLGIAYLFFTYALQKVKVVLASAVNMALNPLLSIIFGILLVGELITLKVAVGGSIIIASGLIIKTRTALMEN